VTPGNGKDATPLNSNFAELLSVLNAESVRYLVVGGYAVISHGTSPASTA